MVTAIHIYYEGDDTLGRGFRKFFASILQIARQRRIPFRLIHGGSQENTVADFLTAVHTNVDDPDTLDILLVDSEGPSHSNDLHYDRLRQALQNTSHWQRERRGITVQPNQFHWMVQVMEAWFLADRDALRDYYGQQFNTQRLPGQPAAVESIPKDDVLRGLTRATERTRKGRYHKTRHAPDLLESVDVGKVRGNAPACARLLRTLEGVLA